MNEHATTIEDLRESGYGLGSRGLELPEVLYLITYECGMLDTVQFATVIDGWADGYFDYERWRQDERDGVRESVDQVPW